jgi:hypothetical protein
MKKIFLVLVALLVMGVAVSAFDLWSFPSPISAGNILVSPTFNYGRYYTWSSALGVSVSVDYALGFFPLTVGGEGGITFLTGSGWTGSSFMTVPIFGRVAWHPNWEIPNLDTYIMLKLGFALVLDDGASGGFASGGSVGGRYFFSKSMGAFAEFGYDNIPVHTDWYSWAAYIRTFVHAGVTFRF